MTSMVAPSADGLLMLLGSEEELGWGLWGDGLVVVTVAVPLLVRLVSSSSEVWDSRWGMTWKGLENWWGWWCKLWWWGFCWFGW
ncbi:hypothetical protein ACFX2H_043780 [Malus domestica]